MDMDKWPAMRELFTKTFKGKTRTEWEKIFDGTDACCTPVLEYPELEMEPGREGDQRPAVTLRETPCLAQKEGAGREDAAKYGQGAGVAGNGYAGTSLSAGQGGEDLLQDWTGWVKGQDYVVSKGGLTVKLPDEKSRL